MKSWLSRNETLINKYAMDRKYEMVPLTFGEGETVLLIPGEHSKFIKDIIEEFAPRFVGGAEVIYVVSDVSAYGTK